MNDFLDNLVSRSLSRVETVRPQVISLFEPAPVNSGAIFHDSAMPELPLVERGMEDPIAERVGQAQSLWRAETGQHPITVEPLIPQERTELHSESRLVPPVETQGQAAEEPIAIIPYSPVEPSPNVPTGTPPRAIKRKRAAMTPLTTQEASDPKLHNEYKSRERSIAASQAQITSLVLTQVTPIRTEQPVASVPPKPIASRSVPVEPERKHPDVPPKVIGKKITETIVREHHVEGRASPAHEVKTTQLQPASATPAAPIVPASIIASPRVLPGPNKQITTEAQSIHVTIGRVEVRATVPPPVRSRQQTAPAPVMSLDEYLRQRTAGDRR